MNIKRIFPILAMAFLLATALACNLSNAATPALTPAPQNTTDAGNINTATPNTPDPTDTPAPTGIAVSFSGTSFTIPSGIASGGGPQAMAAISEQDGAPWDVGPAHLKFSLENYPLNGTMLQPEIYVYPAQEYEAVSNGAAESLKRLRALTSGAGMDVTNQSVPFVPFFNATQIFEAQAMPIKFQNGSGIRTLTQYDQASLPVNNYELIYHFEGLTSDGKYYLIAIFPVSLPTLAADGNPDFPVPAGGIPFNKDDPAAYYEAIAKHLNAAAPETFTPNLTTLDALIQSINVTTP